MAHKTSRFQISKQRDNKFRQ